MSKSSVILFPKTAAMLKQLGENMRLARLRRNVTARLTAERAGISVTTLTKIEHPATQEERGQLLTDEADVILDECDEEFYHSEENLESLNNQYIMEHRAWFS